MTLRPYRPDAALTQEVRRPIIPLSDTTSRLFPGWGPKF